MADREDPLGGPAVPSDWAETTDASAWYRSGHYLNAAETEEFWLDYCTRCGAIVHDQQVHDRWHEGLER
jgi:hypothetical protein